jgi:hypothetical protein
MKFRTRLETVDAIRTCDCLEAMRRDWRALPGWLQAFHALGGVVVGRGSLFLKTPEGTMEAREDGWIVRLPAGDIYPCGDDVFRQRFCPEEEFGDGRR